MKLQLRQIGELISASATPEGWQLTHSLRADLSDQESWPANCKSGAIQIHQMLDLGLADIGEHGFLIPWQSFRGALDERFSLLEGFENSPLIPILDAQGDLGYPDFRYQYSFRLGAGNVAFERIGYFVQQLASGRIFLLDCDTFSLLEEMDCFNARPESHRKAESWADESWEVFARVKELAVKVGAKIADPTLRGTKVVVASEIDLKIVTHPDGSISYAPRLLSDDGKSEALIQDDSNELEQRFLRTQAARARYALDQANEDRLYILFPQKQKQVLERMKRVRQLRGTEKDFARNNPAAFFEELGDVVYWNRVTGVGEYQDASVPSASGMSGGFLEHAPALDAPRQPKAPDFPGLGIDVVNKNNDVVTLSFRSHEELGEARAVLSRAFEFGQKECVIQGQAIPITQELREALNDETTLVREVGENIIKGRLYLLTHTNQESLWEDPLVNDPGSDRDFDRFESIRNSWHAPESLGVDLLPHQNEALKWLHLCTSLQPGRRGALLADDMGLGKTLQVLTYLASLIERGSIREGSLRSPDVGPWRPILIVAPLILVENDTWPEEMSKRFGNGGEIFKPLLVLHGSGIDQVRTEVTGRDTVIGRPSLDCEKLMQYRVIITNYETVVNFQHSLAQLKDGKPIWSVIVTDEAQKYKSPQTKISHALKAIDSPFHIACTGTPVENRLLDVWNILDTIQPSYLGESATFNRTYEVPVASGQRDEVLRRLKATLRYQEPHAFLMRREKSDLRPGSLPEKRIQRLFCEMSAEEVDAHLSLLEGISSSQQGTHLKVLHSLVQLYQHPALFRLKGERDGTQKLLQESSKLRAVISTLKNIRAKGEKAIVFARLIDVQNLLAEVIQHELGVRTPIINGVTSGSLSSSSAGTGRARKWRKQALDEFRSAPGFGVIILSPFVAGIGLTITEANHVIHYGRWWNPAVEAQATDRAYRIGAKLPVTVYLPILRDATGRVPRSFDELLDDLLERKTALAKDFLSPTASEDELGQELYSNLFKEPIVNDQKTRAISLKVSEVDSLSPDNFEAMVATLYKAMGYAVVLTSIVGDGGADVVAIKGNHRILIQAKHSRRGIQVDSRGLDDVLAAHGTYGEEIRGTRFECVVITNSMFDSGTQSKARQQGIKLISRTELVEMLLLNPISRAQILESVAGRARNFVEGIGLVKSLIGH